MYEVYGRSFDTFKAAKRHAYIFRSEIIYIRKGGFYVRKNADSREWERVSSLVNR